MAQFDDPEILRSVLEGLPSGVYLVGRDGKIAFWNSGAERITGHLRQDVVGRACREDFLGNGEADENGEASAQAVLEAVLRDGKAAESRVSFRHKAGHQVLVRLRAFPMRNVEGALIGVAECFDELTDASEWNRRHDKLAEYGCLDEASGVLTHKMMEIKLRECLEMHAAQQVPFCAVCIAFDHLDEIKSRFGTGAIAAVLRLSGQTLENSLRPTDFLGRWKENEFLALVTECTEAEVSRVGERLRKMIGSAKLKWWGDTVPVTIAMGATEARAEDNIEEILRRAEEALSQCIAEGGNQIMVWKEAGNDGQ